jgi:hypothetical protein
MNEQGGQLAKNLDRLGVSFDKGAADKAKKLSQQFELLKLVATGLGIQLLSQVAPALTELSKRFVAWAANSDLMDKVKSAGEDLVVVIHDLAAAFDFVGNHATEFKIALAAIIALKFAGVIGGIAVSASKAGTTLGKLAVVTSKFIGSASGLQGVASALNAIGITGVVSFTALATAFTIAAVAGYKISGALSDVRAQWSKNSGVDVKWVDQWRAGLQGLREEATVVGLSLKALWESRGDPKAAAADRAAAAALSKQLDAENASGQRAIDAAKKRIAAANQPTDNKPDKPDDTPTGDKPILPVLKTDPYAEKLKELRDAAKAAGKALVDAFAGPDAKRVDAANAEAQKTIDQVNKALEAKGQKLTQAQEASIRLLAVATANTKAETEFASAIKETSDKAQIAIQQQRNLTTAQAEGGAAVAKAEIANERLAETYGKSKEWVDKYLESLDSQDLEKFRAKQQEMAAQLTLANRSLEQSTESKTQDNRASLFGKDAEEAQQLADKIRILHIEYDGFTAGTGTEAQAARDALQKNIEALRAQAAAEHDSLVASNARRLQSPAEAYLEEVSALNQATAYLERYAAGTADARVQQMALKDITDRYLESQTKMALQFGTAREGMTAFFTDLSMQTMNAATIVHDVLQKSFESFNDELSKIISGQKANWQKFFQGIASQLSKLALQMGEKSLFSQFGLKAASGQQGDPAAAGGFKGIINSLLGAKGGKTGPDGSAATPFYVKSVDGAGGGFGVPGVPGIGGGGSGSGAWYSGATGPDSSSADASGEVNNAAQTATSAISGSVSGLMKSATSMATKMLQNVGSMLGGGGGFSFSSLFSGGKAAGGDVSGGMAYMTGEQGKEVFVPHTNGTIIPNHKLGGNSGPVINVAAGVNAVDVQAAVRRGMASAYTSSTRDSQKVQQERSKRLPRMAG